MRFPGDKVGLVDRLLNISITTIDPERVCDGRLHAEVLGNNHSLDWTLIRVLKLTNGSVRPYSLRLSGPTKWAVSRSEVAQAILEVLEENTFLRQAPIISRA